MNKELILVKPASGYRSFISFAIPVHKLEEFITYYRDSAEKTEDYVQAVNYALIIKNRRLLSMERTVDTEDSRLAHLLSLGVGGHMRPPKNIKTAYEDVVYDKDDFYDEMCREVEEETGLNRKSFYDVDLYAKLYHSEHPVDRQHLCYLWVVHIDSDAEVKVADNTINNFKWLTRREVVVKYKNLENWSKMAINYLSFKYGLESFLA